MACFRWTPRRDRDLGELRGHGFTLAECGRILGCSADNVRARLKVQRGAAAAPIAAEAVIAPVVVAVQIPEPVPVRARPGKIALPRYGEMEKRFDPVARGVLPPG